ncbi:MAG: AbrB/MazE/SpoVT family DNA-binding domain-containing protein [Methanoculleus marisnigri]|nr:AbrB/MazE/SpoVT family DNA-binding domain-containing protein [Methanoculleus marisnigri]
MAETLVGTVRSWTVYRSLALTVPYHLREEHGFKKGDLFAVKTDEQGRIIYEKIPGPNAPISEVNRSDQ